MFRSKSFLKEILKHMNNRRNIISVPQPNSKNFVYRLTKLEKQRIERGRLEKRYPSLKNNEI
jgi:hypothetical protein